MDICAKSERCTSDLRRALYRWGVEPAAHDEIIEKLTSEKFVDDARYAAAYVREKSGLNSWGEYKIKAGLKAKCIPQAVITEAMSQIDSTKNSEKIESRLLRKLRTVKYKDSRDLRGKLLRYGLGLGFGYSEVAEAVERICKELIAGDEESDF